MKEGGQMKESSISSSACLSMENIQMYILPGGEKPERKSEGAAGFDVKVRAVLHSENIDSDNDKLRQILFDFEEIPRNNPAIESHVEQLHDELIYRLDPGESVLVGIGFVTAMPPDMFYWIVPRSGLATRWGITVTNAPGTVDSDYRGEAGVLVYNMNKDNCFKLRRGMRIAQIIFQKAYFPNFEIVSRHESLPKTVRGAEGFGSTGLIE